MEESPSKKRRKATFRDVGPGLPKEELVRRLKTAAQGLTSVDQGEDTAEFDGFSASLASSFIFYHKDKDVKSYSACCFADILRIYAPEPPYNEDQLKSILTLLVDQLKGLDSKEQGPSYKRNFYILESLALVKTFNVSLELDAQDIVLDLFKLFFSIVSDEHNARVTSFMLDIMAPLIQEGDNVPTDLLSVVLSYLVNPKKTKKPRSYKLACDLIDRCSTAIEPYIQVFFNNALVLGNKVHNELDTCLYDLMYELYTINKSVLMSVLPQLEFKIKGNEESDRLEAVKLLGRMFDSEDTSFAESNKLLWNCYLGRFRDITPDVRIECVSISKPFLVSSVSRLRSDATDYVCERFIDENEKVRQEVLHTVFEAAIKDIDLLDDKLIQALKERMRDKKWSIRREAITCVGKVYKKIFSRNSATLLQKVSWVPSKVLHQYCINSMDDRLCVERVLHGCLVPVTLDAESRMKRLFYVYSSFDGMATSLFDSMLQHRAKINSNFCNLLTTIQEDDSEDKDKRIHRLSIMIARALPDPVKTQEHLKKLILMCSDSNLYRLFSDSSNVNNDCLKIVKSVSEVVRKITPKSPLIDTIKSLLDRVCPMLVDKSSFVCLLKLIRKYFDGFGDDELDDEEMTDIELIERGKIGLKLMEVFSKVRPTVFQTKQAYEVLLLFLKHNDKEIVEQTLKCLIKVIPDLEDVDKSLHACYKPILNKLVVTGSCKQSKYALRCLHAMLKDSTVVMRRLMDILVDNLNPDEDEENYYTLQTTLAALSEMAILAPDTFLNKQKFIVKEFVVKRILSTDRETTASSKEPDDEWGADSKVSEETITKIQAIKLLVKWLLGMSSRDEPVAAESAKPVLRLLCTLLNNDGDLSGQKKISAQNRSRLRLAAGCGMLKLAQNLEYVDKIELDQYQQVALVIQDSCFEVREKFTIKLLKGLESLRLNPEYLAILALVAVDPAKDRKNRVKQLILKNSQTRRECTTQHSNFASRPYAVLPEYSLPFLVHLLAHHPDFSHKNNKSLLETKEYLWFFLEPLMGTKAENYSFLKKLLENIKRTKDKQDPDDQCTNEKLYVVCDLAIACIMQKTQTFTLKDFPGNVVLPKKLFVLQKNFDNSKSYLPKGFVFSPKKQKPALIDDKSAKTTNKKYTSKRALSVDDKEESDTESPPKKSRNKSSSTSKKVGSSTKKNLGSSTKKNVSAQSNGALKSSVQKVKRNLNHESPKNKSNSPTKKSTSPKKSSPKKNSPLKKVQGSILKKASKSPSPRKKSSVSPIKRGKSKQSSISSYVNGHTKRVEDVDELENDESDIDNDDDDDILLVNFTAVLDEKPAKTKSATPSPKKAKNLRTTKLRNSSRNINENNTTSCDEKNSLRKTPSNDEKPTSKLKIRRKVRARR